MRKKSLRRKSLRNKSLRRKSLRRKSLRRKSLRKKSVKLSRKSLSRRNVRNRKLRSKKKSLKSRRKINDGVLSDDDRQTFIDWCKGFKNEYKTVIVDKYNAIEKIEKKIDDFPSFSDKKTDVMTICDNVDLIKEYIKIILKVKENISVSPEEDDLVKDINNIINSCDVKFNQILDEICATSNLIEDYFPSNLKIKSILKKIWSNDIIKVIYCKGYKLNPFISLPYSTENFNKLHAQALDKKDFLNSVKIYFTLPKEKLLYDLEAFTEKNNFMEEENIIKTFIAEKLSAEKLSV
jgi:hypothetical protein